MNKPTIEEDELKGGHFAATVWQAVTDGVPEQALYVRTWDGGDNKNLIEIKQENGSILINGETIRELMKLLNRWVG